MCLGDLLKACSKIIPKSLLTKTSLCKHDHSCIENTIAGFIKSFIYALGLKIFVNNITLIVTPKRLIQNLLSKKSWQDNFKFVMFVAAMNGTYKLVLCTLRRLLKSDKLAAPIAGFCAGLCCMFDSDRRRRLILMLLLSRMTEITQTMAESRNILKQHSGGAWFAILITSIVAQYTYWSENDCMDSKLYKFVKWAVKTHEKDSNFRYLIQGQNVAVESRVASRMLSNWKLILN